MLYKVIAVLAFVFAVVTFGEVNMQTAIAGYAALSVAHQPLTRQQAQPSRFHPQTTTQSGTAWTWEDTETSCVGQGGTAAQHARAHTYWTDKNDSTSAEVDCGGDFYSVGFSNPFMQLGYPPVTGAGAPGGDVSVAGGYCLGANGVLSSGGYTCMTNDHTISIDGVVCQQNLFLYNPVSGAYVYLGCFDNAGDFGIKGAMYAAGGYH